VSGPGPDTDAVPTAVQLEADGHETAENPLWMVPPGAGTDCSDHAAPFQDSASPPKRPGPVEELPTASQLLAATQVTEVRLAATTPAGVAGVWFVQAVPFHVSAIRICVFEALAAQPTASQLMAVAQETEFSRGEVVAAGAEMACTVQAEPFQDSDASTRLPAPSTAYPTAMHAFGEAHETLMSTVAVDPGTTGAGCTVQAVPFQNSTSGVPTFARLIEPTASQDVADAQETDDRLSPIEPLGFGVFWSAHGEVGSAPAGPPRAAIVPSISTVPATNPDARTIRERCRDPGGSSPIGLPRFRLIECMRTSFRPGPACRGSLPDSHAPWGARRRADPN
jgi:hypothetical protein